MLFILVAVHQDKYPQQQWRATHIKEDGKAIDVWFYAHNVMEAKSHIRKHYPNAEFSDD